MAAGDRRDSVGYDGRVKRSFLGSAALSVTFAVTFVGALGCSGAEDEGGDVPGFQPPAPGANAPAAPGAAPGVVPAPSGVPASPSPTAPGGEAPPPTAGLDTGGAAPVGAPPSGSPAAPAAPVAPVTPSQPGTPSGTASAGCGLASGVPAGAAVVDAIIPGAIVTFPTGYDGSSPKPLVFAFHGAGRTNEQMRTVDSRTDGSELEASFVMAYMKSAGNAWDLNTDAPRFGAALEQIQAQLCVDTAHVFAFGHSSGAQFIVQMLGNPSTRERRFAGVAPVASSRFQNPAWEPLPTLVIHGLNDNQRPGDNDGASDIVQYTESNQCAGGTQPTSVPACVSIADNAAVNAGCREYVGCAAPTLFCNHDDRNYIDNGTPTNHGWPCFANGQILQFFQSLL